MKLLDVKIEEKTYIVNGVYNTERKTIMLQSRLAKDVLQLPIFDESNLFFLEALGEGGSGSVQKAYDKKQNEFIAIKKFNDFQEIDKEKWEEIIMEDDMLHAIEIIRSNRKENEQYFLKYDGVFRKAGNDDKSLILRMENGLASMEDVLRAGKKYSCAELIYVHRKITEGFALLQENGISNRDVKPANIILVENPISEKGFYPKISDFGIACKLEKGVRMVSATSLGGLTKEYAAPEVDLYFEKGFDALTEKDKYNPFLADVFSFGVLTLKMISRKLGRKNVLSGGFLTPQNFQGYEQLLEMLGGMLEENPEKRWDFKRILKYHQDKENDPKFKSQCPNDEAEYAHRFQIECKEKKMEKTFENLEKLYMDHEKMFLAYRNNVTRPREAKFHLDRAWDALGKMIHMLPDNLPKKFELDIKEIKSLLNFGDWFSVMGNHKSEEEYFNKANRKIEEVRVEISNTPTIDEIQHRLITELEADMFGKMGNLYEKTGDLSKAEEFCEKSLKTRKLLFGEDHADIASSLNALGLLNQNMGRLAQAEEFYLRALKMVLSLYGENDSFVSSTLNNMGMLYENMGKLQKAEEVYLRSLKIGQKLFGEKHANVTSTMNNLGSLYASMKEYDKAEEYYLKSLNIRQSIFGEFHAFVATSMNNMGSLYEKMEKLPMAEEFYLNSLKVAVKLFGENDQNVAATINNLGTLYCSMNNFPSSEEFLLKSLQIRQSLFGENHPDFVASLNNLGMLYKTSGNLPKSEEFLLKSLKIGKNLYGENHVHIIGIMTNLADLYELMKKSIKAEEFYLKSLKLSQNIFGENHSEVVKTYNKLGLLNYNSGKFPKSEEYFLKSLIIRQNLYGENHPDVVNSLNNLGMLYKNIGNFTKAEEYYLKSLKIGKTLFGENHFDVAVTLNNLSRLYESQNKMKLALDYAEKAYQIFVILYGQSDQLTIRMFQHYKELLDLNK